MWFWGQGLEGVGGESGLFMYIAGPGVCIMF